MLGLGLVLFYLLLLSLSEILGFNLAYLIAAIVMTAQMGWYLNGLFADKKAALACVGVLIVLYIFSFVLVQMVMYSLLVGSLGLVVALGVLMALSKKLPDFSGSKVDAPAPIPEV
jgi:inner membrane protein